ncbi:MAG: alkaline phosphatase family protein [Nitrospirota bacterium]
MGIWDFIKNKGDARSKVVVIGLDGTPYTLIERFIKDGIMPNLGGIIKRGRFMQMDSSIPEISSVAWTTFMTGTNPGEHGIYGFMDFKPDTYNLVFPNSGDIKAKTVWEILGEDQKRTVVINLPSTYPAKEIRGILIAGFVAIDIKKAVFPSSILPEIEDIGYRIDIDTMKARESKEYLVEDLNNTLEKRIETIFHFYEKEEWDLFIGIITETDRLHHFLFDALDDEDHKYHSMFIDYYKRIDKFIGNIYDRIDKNTRFIILSDHGFCRLEKEVYINQWLKQNGYLRFNKDIPDSYNDIHKGTRAFALDPARIYINLKGRFPDGCVENGKEYNRIRDEITEGLLNLDTAIKRVYRKEEIYSGPYLSLAPDLILSSKYGYDLKGSIKKGCLMEKGLLTGMHTQDDALFFINREMEKEPNRMNIKDVMSIIEGAVVRGQGTGRRNL